MRKVDSVVSARRVLSFVIAVAAALSAVPAEADRCGRPSSRGKWPTATDALYVLRGAVGQAVCPDCECDVDHSGRVLVSDALSVLRAAVGLPGTLSCSACPRDNFVVFLTDDQRADTTWSMPVVQERFVGSGLQFTEAFSTTTECCPFRASFHSGGYKPCNTGVKNNTRLNGAMSHFRDADSLARRLQQAGYATGFIGKYMHGYYPGYVPPGWNSFVANEDGGQLLDWLHLSRITYGTSTSSPATGKIVAGVDEYLTDFHRDEALEFVDKHAADPFFLVVAMYSPHWPSIPADGDEGLFAEYEPAGPSLREEDLSDKPAWVRKVAGPVGGNSCVTVSRAVLESLQSVDRLVGSVIGATEAAGVAARTFFFFLSDNGVMWGEHRLPCDKGVPYEEALRVPLLAAGPDVANGDNGQMVVPEVDLPATILDLAGLEIVGDGHSLVPALRGGRGPARREVLIENYGYLESPRLGEGPLWSGLRIVDGSGKWKYVEYPSGETELYDLVADRYEMQNLAGDPAHEALRLSLRDRLAPQKGLALLTRTLEPALVGAKYTKRLESWGGLEPLHWSVVDGRLPTGLTLDTTTGVIRGIPTTAETQTFTARVTDSGIATHSLKPQEYNRILTLEVKPPS